MFRTWKNLWKLGIVITGMVLLLVLMAWTPGGLAQAHEMPLELATPGKVIVQATPTEDATVTALNKERLAQEVMQLRELNDPDCDFRHI